MEQSDSIKDLQAKRLRFLKAIYEYSTANTLCIVGTDKLESAFGELSQVWPIAKYLHDKGLLEIAGGEGSFRITSAGIDAVEHPEPLESTAGSATVTHNFIHAPNSTIGAIQQGTHNSAQNVSDNSLSPDVLLLIEKLLKDIKDQPAPDESKEAIETYLRALKLEAQKADPNKNMLVEAGKSLRMITEGAIGAMLAPEFVLGIHHLLTLISHH